LSAPLLLGIYMGLQLPKPLAFRAPRPQILSDTRSLPAVIASGMSLKSSAFPAVRGQLNPQPKHLLDYAPIFFPFCQFTYSTNLAAVLCTPKSELA
jgi:hypothetical protein